MSFVFNYIFICILFYLIGSIPTAYIFVKLFAKKDITSEGSGNVGAMNAFEVTNSKYTGILVFAIDFLKGLLPVWFLSYVLQLPLSLIMLPAVLLVLGHNYSVFLKFKGGRGLATAAGIVVILNFWLLAMWCVVFLISISIKKNVHIANVAATVFIPLPIIFFQKFFAAYTWENHSANISGFTDKSEILIVLSSSICLLILLKHLKPISELIKQRRTANE